MPTKTFWLEPTGRARLGLRRYSRVAGNEWTCKWTCASGWHDALTWLQDTVEPRYDEDGSRLPPATQPHDRQAWPTECEHGCGYTFTSDDPWQEWQEPLYRRTDTDELRALHWKSAPPDAPTAEPGASWDATWNHDWAPGPDGLSLMVRLPRPDDTPGTHDWLVDGPATGGGSWTRTGDPHKANVTASPSIAAGKPGEPGYYHGFLKDGVLTDHIG